MNLAFLIIGSALALVFIILLFVGGRYDNMLEPLSGDAFPLKSIYSVGLAMQDARLIKLKGAIGERIRNNSALLYSKKFGEYYARISWAQVLSFCALFLVLTFLMAGMVTGAGAIFLIVLGIFMCIYSGYYFSTYSQKKVADRKEECEMDFPNAISKLALIVNSGATLHDAWEKVAYGKSGIIYDLMQESCDLIKNGTSEIDAIHSFGIQTSSDEIKKFTAALIQSIERGGADLPQFLTNQSAELWHSKRQLVLQKGEKAAGALLAPIAMMFIGVMLIVIVAAMQSFRI